MKDGTAEAYVCHLRSFHILRRTKHRALLEFPEDDGRRCREKQMKSSCYYAV